MTSKFYNEIVNSKIEKEVELVYKKGINTYFPKSIIEHPFECDGYIESNIQYDNTTKVLRLIMEFKYDEDFSRDIQKAKVLIQVIYYLKKFNTDIHYSILPNIILVGDKDECFVIHTNTIMKYLYEDIDWSIAPSEAANKNPKVVLKIAKDREINPFIFRVDKTFSFKDVADKIKELALNIKRFIKITENNIPLIYDYFICKVIVNVNKYSANDLVYVFISLMVSPEDCYPHPNKRNILVLSNKREIQIDGRAYRAFIEHFDKRYTSREKDVFTEISDRLIDDTKRRFNGEFYTPTIWADEAHNMISKEFGENWREEYVVWDCAWGTGNLTRDYEFKELYCSTINESDLRIGDRYNINSIKFQYDFLNDDIELIEGGELLEEVYKLPKELLKSIKSNKPIIFFINPPYATANNAGTKVGDHKEGVAKTKVNELMKNDEMGASSQQLITQFLYRILKFKQIYNLKNINICIYSNPIYMSGSSFKVFRQKFLKNFSFKSGMLFKASYFSGVKESWGISFSIWKSGESNNITEFKHTVKDLINGQIIGIGTKIIYNLDLEKSFSDWIKEDVIGNNTKDAPQLSSAINVKQKGRGRIIDGALGYYVNVSNNVYKNISDVFLLSSASSTANGISITKENYMKVVSNFAARKLVTGKEITWINQKDEYIKPNLDNDLYEEWNNDAIIYSIFNTSSNQSSLRKIEYKNRVYNIKNEFFFMGIDEMKELAIKYDNDDIYNDIRNFGGERYTFTLVRKINFSKEATDVLNKAKEIVEKSFEYRKLFNEDNPNYNINTWDAGWYQIKGIIKEFMKEDLANFNELYKKLADKMKSMIYILKMLK